MRQNEPTFLVGMSKSSGICAFAASGQSLLKPTLTVYDDNSNRLHASRTSPADAEDGNLSDPGTQMQTELFKSVQQRLAGYKSEVEQWKSDHDLAMRCMDFELLLQHGLSIYHALNWIDEAWRRRVYSKEQEYDPQVDESIGTLYEWWRAPCDVVLRELAKFEAHFEVAYADEFRAACREVEGILTEDSKYFRGGDLVTIRDRAIDAYRRGECEPCSE